VEQYKLLRLLPFCEQGLLCSQDVFFEYCIDAVNEDHCGSFENCYVSDRLHKTAVAKLAPNFPTDLSLVGILIEALSLLHDS
jgi:hypothetical protein